jgi:hypothetical protein
LDNIEDLLGQSLVSEWEGLWVWSRHCIEVPCRCLRITGSSPLLW